MAGHAPFRPTTERRPIDRLVSPIHRFLRVEAAGGVLLLLGTAAALIWANLPGGAATYEHFWHTYVSVGFGEWKLKLSLAHFVNDALMAIFFFVVGLEIKRELLVGELSTLRNALAPIIAAVGGMAVPALVFVVFNLGSEGLRGWAIPTATDIAFAVGILAMLGSRVPLSLKVFLTALAIVDDIGAVLVIAVFYTSEISMVAFFAAILFLLISLLGSRLGVRTPIFYGVIGLLMWLFLLQSGVHATIGGVLLALTIPAKMRIAGHEFVLFTRRAVEEFDSLGGDHDNIMTNPPRQAVVHGLQHACEHVLTPLNRLELALHPWVAFLIMPIFALANAGVPLMGGADEGGGSGSNAVGFGIALGLLLGKPVGVIGGTWLAVRSGFGRLPEGTNWTHITGAGFLAGIGFTMSLFIANLAFRDMAMLESAKLGILGGSLVAGVVGFVILRRGSSAVREPSG